MTIDEIFDRAETLCLLAVDNPELLEEYEAAMKAAQAHEHNGWKRSTGMTQADIVLNHMKSTGSISAREALLDHDITSAALARRICDLEERGVEIIRNRHKNPVTNKQYTRYSLSLAEQLV